MVLGKQPPYSLRRLAGAPQLLFHPNDRMAHARHRRRRGIKQLVKDAGGDGRGQRQLLSQQPRVLCDERRRRQQRRVPAQRDQVRFEVGFERERRGRSRQAGRTAGFRGWVLRQRCRRREERGARVARSGEGREGGGGRRRGLVRVRLPSGGVERRCRLSEAACRGARRAAVGCWRGHRGCVFCGVEFLSSGPVPRKKSHHNSVNTTIQKRRIRSSSRSRNTSSRQAAVISSHTQRLSVGENSSTQLPAAGGVHPLSWPSAPAPKYRGTHHFPTLPPWWSAPNTHTPSSLPYRV
ncbi:hypothetical protein EDC01DRAFT_441865 [Geopyxis carbonaria]|nr:hypothetical protein EDC01DRAFT_441865 [Geopyxis carbonaria]